RLRGRRCLRGLAGDPDTERLRSARPGKQVLPRSFLAPSGDAVPDADEWQAEEGRRRQQAFDDLDIVEAHVPQATVTVGLRGLVKEGPSAELVHEPAKLTARDRLAGQVDLVDL